MPGPRHTWQPIQSYRNVVGQPLTETLQHRYSINEKSPPRPWWHTSIRPLDVIRNQHSIRRNQQFVSRLHSMSKIGDHRAKNQRISPPHWRKSLPHYQSYQSHDESRAHTFQCARSTSEHP